MLLALRDAVQANLVNRQVSYKDARMLRWLAPQSTRYIAQCHVDWVRRLVSGELSELCFVRRYNDGRNCRAYR